MSQSLVGACGRGLHATVSRENLVREYASATFGTGQTLVTVRSGVVVLELHGNNELLDGTPIISLLPEQAERLAAQFRLVAKKLRKAQSEVAG